MIENELTDPFSGAIPGESLASSKLGSLPTDSPAKVSDPEKALEAIIRSLEDEESKKYVRSLLLAGVSCQTLSAAIVLKCVTDGIISPDVAELIKPFLLVAIFRMHMDRIERINVTEERFSSEEDDNDIDNLLSGYKNKTMPDNKDLKDIEFDKDIEEFLNEDESEGFMNRRMDQ